MPSHVEALFNLPHNARSASLMEYNGNMETSDGLGNLGKAGPCGAFFQIVRLRSRWFWHFLQNSAVLFRNSMGV